MTRSVRFLLLAALPLVVGAAASPRRLAAQGLVRTDPGEVVERIVAVVGDSVVTLTELQEYVLTLRAQGQIPNDPAAMAEIEEQALEALVDQLLILQAARRDSALIPEEAEITSRVNQLLEQTIQRMGGSAAFLRALQQEGITQGEYRDIMTQQIRREQIRQLFMAVRLRTAAPVVITEAEVRQVFEARRGELGQRPEMVTIRQTVISPEASDSAWAAAEATIDSVLARARAGEDFAELAREHSHDASASAGGDLGWFRRDQMVRELEDAAFRLIAGQISEPVRTQFGWHVIKAERVRPGEVNAHHILIRPELDTTGDERTRTTADEIARRARAGEEFGVLLDEFRGQLDAEIPDSTAFPRPRLAEALPPAYQQPMAGAAEGDIVGPFPFPVRDRTAWVVVEVTDVRPAGEYTFEEMRGPIEAQLTEQRQIERIFQELRGRTYVDIRL